MNWDSIYLVFQKVFDNADYFIILKQCFEKGVGGKIGVWIADNLIGRMQRVIVNNETSAEVTIGSEVA